MALEIGNKKGKLQRLPFLVERKPLERDDVLSLRAFLALCDFELNLLPFRQRFETRAYNGTEVRKDVWARLLLNKAKTLRFVEPFNGTSNGVRHNKYPIVNNVNECRENDTRSGKKEQKFKIYRTKNYWGRDEMKVIKISIFSSCAHGIARVW